MRDQIAFDKIDLHLIRVLHTVLTERSVSRAALRLGMHQPAVSAALKRLRELAGDPLLVRSGAGMAPTDAALRMIEPAASILRSAEALFSDARGFEPQTTEHVFRIAASDYLDPLFLPLLVAQVKAQAVPTDAEIAAQYQQDRARYAPTEKRTITQVVVADQAGAAAIAAKVKAGTAIADAARAAYNWVNEPRRGMFAPPRMCDRIVDVDMSTSSDLMRALFPRARPVVVNGVGHWVHSEAPEVVAETLRRVLHSLPQG